MASPLSEELKQQWKDDILKQRGSGLSIVSWCRRHEIAPHVFHYWQKKLFAKDPIDTPAFTEIATKTNLNISDVGFILECQGVNIYLSNNFQSSALKKCLEVLKEC
jgi:hypothetical protein